MNKIKFSFFFFLMTLSAHSQKYYDSNDLKYFIDFTNRKANLKFQDLKINGPIEEFISHYGNRYTVVKGDSIHWLLQQSDKRNKYLSYLIKVYRDNGINFFDLDIVGTIELNRMGIVIETNLPTLTRFTGSYDSQLNANVEFVKKGIIVGNIDFKEKAIFSLNLDIEKKVGTLSTLEMEVDKEGIELKKRKTTTFIIQD